jgi:hypothetical protein
MAFDERRNRLKIDYNSNKLVFYEYEIWFIAIFLSYSYKISLFLLSTNNVLIIIQ